MAAFACQRLGPWAIGARDVAQYPLECASGAYSLDNLVRFGEGASSLGFVSTLMSGPTVARLRMSLHILTVLVGGFAKDFWGCMDSQAVETHLNLLPRRRMLLLIGAGCSVLSLVLCSLSSVLRVGENVLVLQAVAAMHVDVDNLDVVWHVDRLVQGMAPCKPFELLNDGDLLHLVKTMFEKRVPGLI